MDLTNQEACNQMLKLRYKYDALQELWEHIKSLSDSATLTQETLNDINNNINKKK